MTEPTRQQFVVSPHSIQKNIVRSARPYIAAYGFFSITDAKKFREYIAKRIGSGQAGCKAPVPSGGAANLVDTLKSTEARIFAEGATGEPQPGLHTTLALTWSGLTALGIDPVTLETFPEPFKEGMAARAHFLCDTGDSAPENWEGWLGHRGVHGLIGVLLPFGKTSAGNSEMEKSVGENGGKPPQAALKALRAAYSVAMELARKLKFSDGHPPREMGELEQVSGIRILQLEVGLTPLKKFNDKWYRVEHFGFRDGISQPFVDLGLAPPPPGGGTPRRDGTWAPVAPGEIFLGPLDEDGLRAIQPANRDLRLNGTYMVFRKLAQDVVGFAHFLKANTDNQEGEHRLAAQMLGRWQNGAPLVRHPKQPKYYAPSEARRINDFRFNEEDPHGLKCPVGSHVRRTNPRDVQLRDVAKRHRILRQSIPYGGELIERPEDWDGEERGLLFICYNSRIDGQFEFIQREWINRGEVFGQVGLNKCPITGANHAAADDEFHLPNDPAAVSHIPRFVTTRGGEYFFVPSMAALEKIGKGATFEPQLEDGYVQSLPAGSDRDVSMGVNDDTTCELIATWAARSGVDPAAYTRGSHLRPNPSLSETPSLFSEQRLAHLGSIILRPDGTEPVIRFQFTKLRDTQSTAEPAFAVFLGQYDDVVKVLSDETAFGVDQYREHIEEITHAKSMIIGLPTDAATRTDRLKILGAAIGGGGDFELLEPFARQVTNAILSRVLPAGRMDLVRDLALVVPVMVAKQFFGLPGPNRLSPTAIAAMFARLEFTDIPPDWLAQLQQVMEDEKPVLTIQAWAQAAFREVFLNIVRARELTISAQRMTDEMLLHIDQLMEDEYRKPSRERHLLANLMAVKRKPEQFGLRREDFREPDALDKIDEHVRAILAELLVGGIYTVGKALANIVDLMLSPDCIENIIPDGRERSDGLMVMLKEICGTTVDADRRAKLDAFIAECLRFKPVSPILFRVCKTNITINGVEVNPGDLVCPMIETANMDPRKFRDFRTFRLDRPKADFLHFGPQGGPHRCLGELMAMAELRGMLQELSQLENFRRAAGPRGKLEELLRLPQSLVVRFNAKSRPRSSLR